jgi:hypothetical protein
MEAKIFVIGFPSMKGLMEEITSLIEEAFDKPCSKKCERKSEPKCCSQERDFTTPRFKNHTFMPPAPIPQWGVTGKKADENLRFGAEFAIDEPRRSDYDNREDFEYDHQLFDEFVSAGEDCVERGLARPEGVTAHRCNAVRKKLNEAPPMNLDLIGETDWWDEEDFDWDY